MPLSPFGPISQSTHISKSPKSRLVAKIRLVAVADQHAVLDAPMRIDSLLHLGVPRGAIVGIQGRDLARIARRAAGPIVEVAAVEQRGEAGRRRIGFLRTSRSDVATEKLDGQKSSDQIETVQSNVVSHVSASICE